MLRKYQQEAVESIEKAFFTSYKVLLILATGTGKTIVFAELARRYVEAGKRVLVLAHRGELIKQAIDKLRDQAGIEPGKEKADSYASPSDDIVVASVQTLQRDRMRRFSTDHFGLIIVDEAHHCVSDSYQNILRYFRANVLGVTATPDRSDNKELGDYFDKVAYQYSLLDAIKEKYLVNIVGKRIKDFDIDLSELRTRVGDFAIEDLDRIVEDYIAPISESIKRETGHLRTMVFLPSVVSSEMVADVLRASGVQAAALSGADTLDRRERVLSDFSHGKVTHLCNCNLFLEGYDEPKIQAIVMARPTLSRIVYSQAVGRGTRLAPGKEELLLVEFTYNYRRHKLVSAYDLFARRGYEEAVREEAKSREGDGKLDYLSLLDSAEKYYHSLDRIMASVKVSEYGTEFYNPFELCNLEGIDLSCEMDVKWERKNEDGTVAYIPLLGRITEKQIALLRKFGVHNPENLTKAQASIVIDTIAGNGWKVENLLKKAQFKLREQSLF